MMTWDRIKRNWRQVTDKIKFTWCKLSDDDLTAIAGDRNVLFGMLQQRYVCATVTAEEKAGFAQRSN